MGGSRGCALCPGLPLLRRLGALVRFAYVGWAVGMSGCGSWSLAVVTVSSPLQMRKCAEKGHVTHSQWLVGLGARLPYSQTVFCVLCPATPHPMTSPAAAAMLDNLHGRGWGGGGGNVGPGGQGLEAALDLMPEERWKWV